MYSSDLDSAGLSEIGPVREENQDAIRLADGSWPAGYGALFALADGMGGYAHGGIASTVALDSLYHTYYAARAAQNGRGANPRALLKRGIDAANLNVYQEAQGRGAGRVRMGTTVTAACLMERTLYVGHVGDSRAYLVRDGQATCLTNDHTTVGDLVRMRLLAPDRVRTHAQRSILNRAVGLALFVQADFTEVALREDDRVILCSDGLWSVIEDEEFAGAVAEAEGAAASAEALSRALVNMALERESDDNVSVIAIHVRRLAATGTALPRRRGPLHTLRDYINDAWYGT